MKLKVCGMKYLENMEEVIKLSPDFLGFIFYPKSPRYMADTLNPDEVARIPAHIKKVGVFVNETTAMVLEKVNSYQLDLVQLHGHESPEFCETIKKAGPGVIKVFSIDKVMDWSVLDNYKDHVDYFLFDTKSKHYGGMGKSFNWEVLKSYDSDIPYFLSGGVGLDNIGLINKMPIKQPFALDVNSRFEITPGNKDIKQLAGLTEKLASAF